MTEEIPAPDWVAVATCDAHVIRALNWVIESRKPEELLKTTYKTTIRKITEPDDHFFCWCKQPATWFFRRTE